MNRLAPSMLAALVTLSSGLPMVDVVYNTPVARADVEEGVRAAAGLQGSKQATSSSCDNSMLADVNRGTMARLCIHWSGSGLTVHKQLYRAAAVSQLGRTTPCYLSRSFTWDQHRALTVWWWCEASPPAHSWS